VSGTLANENRKRGRGKGSSCAVASSQVKKVKKHDFSLQLFSYSALASFRMGMSGSASFQRAKKSCIIPRPCQPGRHPPYQAEYTAILQLFDFRPPENASIRQIC
jgi:hypothetical protein